MRNTITGLVEKPVDAQRIIDELTTRCLADRSDITLISQESAQLSGTLSQAVRAAGQVAGAAAAAASATGNAAIDFASAVTRSVPGFGVLRAVGGLGANFSRAVLSTAEDVAKAFVGFGVEQNLARSYADALREGSILIVVDAQTDAIARCARQVMATHGAAIPA